MIQEVAIFFLLTTTVAVSQSPNSSTSSTNYNYGTCKPVKTINRPVTKIFMEQPVYYLLLVKIPKHVRLDNVCLTFFALPGSTKFITYISWIYIDGSQLIETFITQSYAEGANFWTYPTRGYVNYNLGYIGCGAYLRYNCPKYGNTPNPFLFGFGPGIGPIGNGTGKITDECIQNARKLAQENGLDLGDIYVPPYNLPTRCIYQHICQSKGSNAYCSEGNSCKASNTSSDTH